MKNSGLEKTQSGLSSISIFFLMCSSYQPKSSADDKFLDEGWEYAAQT
jgi:hypothetical protein